MATRASEAIRALRKDAEGRPEPTLAIGHLELPAVDVAKTTRFLVEMGMLRVVLREQLAVLELRGGTHIVVKQADGPAPAAPLPFDLMVDDLEAARRKAQMLGAEPSEIRLGRIHDSFTLTDPSGHTIQVVSSHTVWQES